MPQLSGTIEVGGQAHRPKSPLATSLGASCPPARSGMRRTMATRGRSSFTSQQINSLGLPGNWDGVQTISVHRQARPLPTGHPFGSGFRKRWLENHGNG